VATPFRGRTLQPRLWAPQSWATNGLAGLELRSDAAPVLPTRTWKALYGRSPASGFWLARVVMSHARGRLGRGAPLQDCSPAVLSSWSARAHEESWSIFLGVTAAATQRHRARLMTRVGCSRYGEALPGDPWIVGEKRSGSELPLSSIRLRPRRSFLRGPRSLTLVLMPTSDTDRPASGVRRHVAGYTGSQARETTTRNGIALSRTA
jgi:hypothetical protein